MFVAVIGGLGRIEGPIIGTVVFSALQSMLSDLGGLYLVVLGGVAITITLLAPRGIWGIVVSRFPMELFGIQPRVIITDSGTAAPDAPRGSAE